MADSPEELAPCGEAGGLQSMRANTFFPHKRDYPSDLSDCRVARPKPFRLVIWEPLLTNAPQRACAYCCYVKTVIFYNETDTDGPNEWDAIETRLSWDDVVSFEGDLFTVGGGTVKWADGRWWMCRHARRVADDFSLPTVSSTAPSSDERQNAVQHAAKLPAEIADDADR